jgi:two-component sensor histidine kinase
MALLHETLYRSQNMARVNFAQYVETLCAHLLRTYGRRAAHVEWVNRLTPLELSPERAVPGIDRERIDLECAQVRFS